MEPENILKGRIAEGLVEELLKQCGNKVYRFGYETILQNLTQIDKSFDRESEIGRKIRSIPDFIVINEQGRPFFIEVKFRTEFLPYRKDVDRFDSIEKLWNPKIIIVTVEKPYFMISNNPPQKEEGNWNWEPLRNNQDLGIKKDVLEKFEKLVEKYCIKKPTKI